MPLDVTRYGEDTLGKVREALRPYAASEQYLRDMIGALQNAGILFRERAELYAGLNEHLNSLVQANNKLADEVKAKNEEIRQLQGELTELKELDEVTVTLPAPLPDLTELRQWAVEQVIKAGVVRNHSKYADDLVNYVTTGKMTSKPPTNGVTDG